MSSPSSPPLILDIGARRAETRVAHLATAAGAFAPWLFEFGPIASIAMSGLAVGILYGGLRRVGWLASPRRIVRLSWLADGRWSVSDGAGAVSECELCRGTRAVAGVVWLQLRTVSSPNRNFYMLLTRGDGFAEPLRRLIVRLRLDGLGKPAPLLDRGLPRAEGRS